MKKCISGFFVLLIICIINTCVNAELFNTPDLISGSAGNSIHWVLTEDGTLSFLGSGAMDDCKWDYENQKVNQPWDMYHALIKAVEIEDGINNIGECAFRECGEIEKITIPASVTNIGWCAFVDCLALREFVVDQENPSFTAKDGVLFDKSMKTLIWYPTQKEGVEYTVPDTVERVMDFSRCHLKKIAFPDSVTLLDNSAFSGCDDLTDIILPKNLEVIEPYLFWGADSLRSITISKSVKQISRTAISLCRNLRDIYYEGSEEDWKKIDIDPDNRDLFNATIHFLAEKAMTPDPYRQTQEKISDESDEEIHIFLGTVDLSDLMSQNIRLSMYIGDSMTLHAEIPSKAISDKIIEWSLSDGGQKSLYYVLNNDNSITITCVSAEMESVQLTANCEGKSVTITLYPKSYW